MAGLQVRLLFLLTFSSLAAGSLAPQPMKITRPSVPRDPPKRHEYRPIAINQLRVRRTTSRVGSCRWLGTEHPVVEDDAHRCRGAWWLRCPWVFFGLEYEYSLGYSLDGFAGFGSSTDIPGNTNVLSDKWPIYDK